jgi:hypothetical protein
LRLYEQAGALAADLTPGIARGSLAPLRGWAAGAMPAGCFFDALHADPRSNDLLQRMRLGNK